MGSESRVIGADESAGFDTVEPYHCFGVRFPSPKSHPVRLTLFCACTILTLAIGCARIPTSASVAPPTSSIIDGIVRASVKVAIERDTHRVMSASGIVIASRPEGPDAKAVSYVLTSAHVLGGKEGAAIFVGFCGPAAVRGKFAATVISQGRPETLDLALLRVSGIAAPSVLLPEDDSVRLGTQILVVGFPEGERLGISSGIVSQLPLSEIQNGIPAEREEHRIVISADAPRGVSGGGVFDRETGRLIGIVQGHQVFSIPMGDQAHPYSLKVPVPGATFVVPMAQIRPFLMGPEVAKEWADLPPITTHAVQILPK
jgi:serine protease Do